MRCSIARILLISAFVLSLAYMAAAQQKPIPANSQGRSVAGMVLKGAVKTTVIVVGSAGKTAWVTTKFLGGNVAWPVVRIALMKIPEKAAVSGLKAAGKLSFAYLKAKLP